MASRQGHSWSEEEDRRLYESFVAGKPIADVARDHQRSTGGIRARLKRLKLLDDQGKLITPIPSFCSYSQQLPKSVTCPKPILSPSVPAGHVPANEYPPSPQNSAEPATLPALASGFALASWRDMMSTRLFHGLGHLGIQDIRQIFTIDTRTFLRQENLGRKSLEELNVLRTKIENDPSLLQIPKALPSSVSHAENEDSGDNQDEINGETEETAQKLLQLVDNEITALELDDRNTLILRVRMGISPDHERMTLRELGIMFGVSRERIRQLEKKGFRKFDSRLRRATNPGFRRLARLSTRLFPEPSDTKILSFLQMHLPHPGYIQIAGITAVLLGLHKSRSSAIDALCETRWRMLQEKQRHSKRVYKEGRVASLQRQIFQHVLWPDEKRMFDPPIAEFMTQRDINDDSFGRIGAFYSQKAAKNIFYESAEEFKLYSLMENAPDISWYCEQPMIIPYQIEGRPCLYHPDLAVVTNEGHGIIVEVKTTDGLVALPTLPKALAAVDHLHKMGMGYLLTDSRGRSLTTFSAVPVPGAVWHEFKSLLDTQGIVRLADYKRLRNDLNFSWKEFYSLIINYDLALWRGPFRISRLPPDLSFQPLLAKYNKLPKVQVK